ncbi:MAG: hypothetical protein H6873_00755 [Hyphomicrobiaceae bacterium]|nr:hypothetical protein [Hyphomicrobiaceae bacterium]
MGSVTRKVLAASGIALALGLSSVTGALAQQVENLGVFTDWTAWKGSDSNGTICYISAQPKDAQPTNVNRDPIHFLIIHRQGLKTRNEAQTLVGYPLEANSKPQAIIDGKAFDMLVDGEAAWLASESDEAPFVAAMKAGRTLIVKARSQRGTDTTDTYSLSGATAAMNAIDAACPPQ